MGGVGCQPRPRAAAAFADDEILSPLRGEELNDTPVVLAPSWGESVDHAAARRCAIDTWGLLPSAAAENDGVETVN